MLREWYIKENPPKTSETRAHAAQMVWIHVPPIKKFQIVPNDTPLTTPKMILKTLEMLDKIRHLAWNNSSGIQTGSLFEVKMFMQHRRIIKYPTYCQRVAAAKY